MPGPTKPTHVFPISSCLSPWFQANPEATHTGVEVGFGHAFALIAKKKSGSANCTHVGVRFGSALTMCSAFLPTGSAIASVAGTFCQAPVPLLYGFGSDSAPT